MRRNENNAERGSRREIYSRLASPSTPHPSWRFAPIHLLPQGEKVDSRPAFSRKHPHAAPAAAAGIPLREKARYTAAMKWQGIVLVAQLVLGGGLVVYGARMAAHYYLASIDKSERLARATGEPPQRSLRPVAIEIALMLVGGLMLATTDMVTGLLLPAQAP